MWSEKLLSADYNERLKMKFLARYMFVVSMLRTDMHTYIRSLVTKLFHLIHVANHFFISMALACLSLIILRRV